MIAEKYKQFVDEMTRIAGLCYNRGLVGAAGGNLSVRLPNGEHFLCTASGVSLRDVAAYNVVMVDRAGNVVDDSTGFRPSKELGFHLSIYETRPLASAVVHVHPIAAIALSAVYDHIPAVTVSAKLKLKQTKRVAELDPGTHALRDAVGAALSDASDDATVMLLESHGVVCFDENLSKAFDDAELAADTAEIAYRRLSAGLPIGTAAAMPAVRVTDLSTPLDETLHVYPGDPSYRRHTHADFPEAGAYLSKIEMGLHSGSHVDVPLHFIESGADITSFPIARFFGPAIIIDAPKEAGENLMPADIAGYGGLEGRIVLFRTGWEERANTPLFFSGEWPGISVDLAELLVKKGVKATGGDIASADGPTAIAAGAATHKVILRGGIPIYEGLVNMSTVIDKELYFYGVPLRISGGEASPVRAFSVEY